MEAKNWQSALQAVREHGGGAGPISQFSIELLSDGYRAIDPVGRLRYVVKRTADDAATTVEGPPPSMPSSAISTSVRAPDDRPTEPTSPPVEPRPAASAPRVEPQTSTSPVAQSIPRPPVGPPASITVPASIAVPSTVAVPATISVPQTVAAPATVAAPLTALSSTQRSPNPISLPTCEVLAARIEDPTPQSPLTYREYSYAVPVGTPDHLAEIALRLQFADVLARIASAPQGKMVNLAIFDVVFTGKPPKPPLATLAWKDWRGEPEIRYPARERAAAAQSGVVVAAPGAGGAPNPPAPAPVIVAPPPPAAAPPPAPVVVAPPPPAAAPPGPPPRAPSVPKVAVAPVAPSSTVVVATPPTAPPKAVTASTPAAPPRAVTASTPAAPPRTVTASTPAAPPKPVPAPAPAAATELTIDVELDEPPAAPPPAPSAAAPVAASAPAPAPAAVVPAPVVAAAPAAPAPAAPAAAAPVAAEPAPPPPAPSAVVVTEAPASAAAPATIVEPAPSAEVADPFGAGASTAPAVVKPAPAPTPAAAGKRRLTGDELLSDLFDAMHDLHFEATLLDGAHFVLRLALAKLPSRIAICHFYDINRREFIIADAIASSREALVTHRMGERDAVVARTMRARRTSLFSGASLEELKGSRWDLVGESLASVAIAPVALGGRFLGLLELANPTDGHPYTEGDGFALAYMGEQLAEFLGQRGLIIDPDAIKTFRPRS